MSIRVFNKPHRSRIREAEFVRVLVEGLRAEHVPKDFPIDPMYLTKTVDTRRLAGSLVADRHMPRARSGRARLLLADLPMQVVVATSAKRISFDVVIQSDDVPPLYLEFHEEQHLNLSVDRSHSVYDLDGRAYDVPRFLQRLVRDVWRLEHFADFTIVWHDWFAKHREQYSPMVVPGFREHHLAETFSFQSFWGR